jgi:hypothetical protein
MAPAKSISSLFGSATPVGRMVCSPWFNTEPNKWIEFFLQFFDRRPNDVGIVMDGVANPRRVVKAEPFFARRPRRFGRQYALLSLLAAVGVLAFIFSAISTVDDDIQQEFFFQRSKSEQCVLANYNAVSNLRTFRVRTVHSALAPPTPQFASYDVTARVSVPGDEIKGRVCSGRTGDRSPPTKST